MKLSRTRYLTAVQQSVKTHRLLIRTETGRQSLWQAMTINNCWQKGPKMTDCEHHEDGPIQNVSDTLVGIVMENKIGPRVCVLVSFESRSFCLF